MVKISISSSLYNLLKKEGKNRGYSSTQEFITHILEKQVINIIDKDLVRQRLEGLGYF